MSYGEFAVKRNLTHYAFYQRRLTLTVTAHESHFLTALDCKVHAAEHLMVAVALGHTLTNHGVVAAAYGGRKLKTHGLVVHLINLNGYYLFKCLDAALNLHGLGGFVSETLYEILGISNLLLLVLIGTELLLAAFLA